MTTSSWGLGQRVAFRFGFIVAVLLLFPFPLYLIPKIEWLTKLLTAPWGWGVSWLAEHVFGLPDPPSVSNGSGDRLFNYLQLVLIALIATLGTIVWSVVDRRRTSYRWLAGAVWVVLRYWVGFFMLGYGFSKIFRLQFSDPQPGRLIQTVGDMSPMGLLWTFMGYSAPYTVFAGLLEAIGGALLLCRRTATIGALVVAAVMTNVVMLNFCYDVPVKLFSMQLLVGALVVAAPRLRPLLSAALGRTATEAPPRTRMSVRWERARLIAKLAFLAGIAWHVYTRYDNPYRTLQPHELHGGWVVDSMIVDGVERPQVASDIERWHELGIGLRGLWILPLSGQREALSLEIDAAKHTMTISLDDRLMDKDRKRDKDGKPDKEVWTYTRPAPDRLTIDGVHRGKHVQATLRLEPERLLMTRGFRWINEAPFNR